MKLTDLFHIALGFATAVLRPYTLPIYIIYVIYQLKTSRDYHEFIEDMVEYLIGLGLGLVVTAK